jgi:formate hydrogenlyase subunit 3/multisubunit Na+/H+ antiporter MnhD subunit
MSPGAPALLLGAAIVLPLAMLGACVARRVRDRMLPFVWLAAVPALAAALAGADTRLAFGEGPVRLEFSLDYAAAVLLGVAAFLWIVAGLYAATYLRGAPNAGRFAACWLMAAAGCLGAFVAADMASLYLLLALLTLGACGLVMHDETPQAWRSSAVYLGLALAGEALLLMAMVMLAQATGSLSIREASAALPSLPQRDLVFGLLVAGLGLKAGLVPLHVWMPLAHAAAPIPASAVLSGAVVKVGLIALGRFLPFDAALPDWGLVLTAAGLFTAFYGVAIGVTQAHPKAVLAYSSVSQMGLIIAVLGMGLSAKETDAPLAAAYYASHHVLVKGALFLSVGVYAATGARRAWPILVPVTVLALSLGGLPFTGGALAKYAVKGPLGEGLAGALANVSAAGTTLLMLHFVHRLRRNGAEAADAAAPMGLLLPWAAIVVACIAVPWGVYLAVEEGIVSNPLAPKALWAALWPVLAGVAAAYALDRWGGRLPRVPQGDVAVVIDAAVRASPRWGAGFARVDDRLRHWAAAGIALAALAAAFGIFLAR